MGLQKKRNSLNKRVQKARGKSKRGGSRAYGAVDYAHPPNVGIAVAADEKRLSTKITELIQEIIDTYGKPTYDAKMQEHEDKPWEYYYTGARPNSYTHLSGLRDKYQLILYELKGENEKADELKAKYKLKKYTHKNSERDRLLVKALDRLATTAEPQPSILSRIHSAFSVSGRKNRSREKGKKKASKKGKKK